MGLLQESDCKMLQIAGSRARQKGLLEHGQALACEFVGCRGKVCRGMEEPQFRTITIESAETREATPLEKFYDRLQKHMDLAKASRQEQV